MLYTILDFTKKLIKNPSIIGNPGCQTIIIKKLKRLGFTIESILLNGNYSFFAWKGVGKTLMFSGHTDVASIGNINKWKFHPFEPVVKNGFLYGRGSVDMKGALSAMVISVEKFIKKYPKFNGRLAFLITSDEEKDSKNGAYKIVKMLKLRQENLHYCIVGEPTSENKVGDVIKNGRRGSLIINLKIYGIQGHVAYPNLLINPIHKSLNFLKELVEKKWDLGNKYFQPTTVQIVNIKSGIDDNITPDIMSLKVNFRFGVISTISIFRKIKNLMKKYNLKYDISYHTIAKPFLSKKGNLIKIVSNTIKKYRNFSPKIETSGGTSDGRFISDLNVQIVELGLVNRTMHKINECVRILDLKILAKIYYKILQELLL